MITIIDDVLSIWKTKENQLKDHKILMKLITRLVMK